MHQEALDFFLAGLEMSLEENKRKKLEMWTLEELWEATQACKTEKSWVNDRLPAEFNKTCWDALSPDLLAVFQKCLERKNLGKGMDTGKPLLYKKVE